MNGFNAFKRAEIILIKFIIKMPNNKVVVYPSIFPVHIFSRTNVKFDRQRFGLKEYSGL